MQTVTARLLLLVFTIMWIFVISELLLNAYPVIIVIVFVIIYGGFIAFALEIDEKYDE